MLRYGTVQARLWPPSLAEVAGPAAPPLLAAAKTGAAVPAGAARRPSQARRRQGRVGLLLRLLQPPLEPLQLLAARGLCERGRGREAER